MDCRTFIVQADLAMSSFDDQRDAHALVRSVKFELGRLAQSDSRLLRSRCHVDRRRRLAEVELVISAVSAVAAFDIGTATLRSSIHASGGSTASWSWASPQHLQIDQSEPKRLGWRRRRRVPGAGRRTWEFPQLSWSAAAEAERRRMGPPLPEFAASDGNQRFAARPLPALSLHDLN